MAIDKSTAPCSGLPLTQPPLFNWLDTRSSGVLLHPTSFPGSLGIGTMGKSVDSWLKFLESAGIKYWQICPLGPTGYGDSPYQCFSAFAGNPYLIDLEPLLGAGLLSEADLAPLRSLPVDHVDFSQLYLSKWPVLFKAFTAFESLGIGLESLYGDFDEFCETHRSWLEPFALFQALKLHFQSKPWWQWPEKFRFHDRAKKARLPEEVSCNARAHSFFQYLFFGQWKIVREKARIHGVEIIGDAPIFVAQDSADIWANPQLFQIDQESGRPLQVAGVPPDYFSEDGQFWGNPLYDWKQHRLSGFEWWIERLRANFTLCDVLRIDHFRAFDSYWSIPANAKNARVGSWEPGPGIEFFEAVKAALPAARLIAEDLGELIPSVLQLREATGLPGMTVLQFAFGGKADNPYLPHNHIVNSITYPGTHDNNTTLGWYACCDEKTKDHVRRYFRTSGDEIGWDFLRAAYSSVSHLAIVPFQDMLSLGEEGRFNVPGKPAGNWQWRFREAQLGKLHRESAGYLRDIGKLFGRVDSLS